MLLVQVEQAAADVKVRETTVARREADLSRQEAATLSGSADAIKREAEVAAREQALGAQLAEIKAAEAQLQEKKLETKELQVSRQAVPCLWSGSAMLVKPDSGIAMHTAFLSACKKGCHDVAWLSCCDSSQLH